MVVTFRSQVRTALVAGSVLASLLVAAPAPVAAADPPCQEKPDPTVTHHFYEDNPTYHGDDNAWTTSTPEAVDLDSGKLEDGLNQIKSNPLLLSTLVIRHGKLAMERYLHNSKRTDSNNIHSASKKRFSGCCWPSLSGTAISRAWTSRFRRSCRSISPVRAIRETPLRCGIWRP
ncbi:hypothetical protein [Fodinicola feengrottensis]|uniref:hypothetical protein n=1 Tax=Fodinicola feengrottensis TaxID=435914 RepID=UPI0024410578|nr:hypothetical protein [Fodinicola feengrottensis]